MGPKVLNLVAAALSILGPAAAVSSPTHPPQQCTASLADTPPQGYNCGKLGSLTNPQPLEAIDATSLEDCATWCRVDKKDKCISFSYDAQNQNCQAFKRALNKQGYKDKTTDNGIKYYNRRCFALTCVDPTPPSDCELQAANPPEQLITNGGFECGLYDWNMQILDQDADGGISSLGGQDASTSSFRASSHTPGEPTTDARVQLSQHLTGFIDSNVAVVEFYTMFTGVDQFIKVWFDGLPPVNVTFADLGNGSGQLNTWYQVNPGRFFRTDTSQDRTLHFSFHGLSQEQPVIYVDDVTVGMSF